MLTHRERRLLEVVLGDAKAEVRFADAILDETNAERMREELDGLLARLVGRHAYFDLGNVEFLSSTWLGLFVSLRRELQAAGSRMTIRDVCPEVYEVFVATRLTAVLDVCAKGRPEPVA